MVSNKNNNNDNMHEPIKEKWNIWIIKKKKKVNDPEEPLSYL